MVKVRVRVRVRVRVKVKDILLPLHSAYIIDYALSHTLT